jgi:hypothetical protein
MMTAQDRAAAVLLQGLIAGLEAGDLTTLELQSKDTPDEVIVVVRFAVPRSVEDVQAPPRQQSASACPSCNNADERTIEHWDDGTFGCGRCGTTFARGGAG